MSVEARPDHAMRPWGVAATVGFTLLIFTVFVMVQMGVAFVYLVVKSIRTPTAAHVEAAAATLDKDGLFLGLFEVVAGPVVLGVTILFAWLRKGLPLRDYLALRPVPSRTMLWWLLVTMLITGLLDVVGYLAGFPQVPAWMMDIYRSAVFLPLLLVALVVVAPVLEEFVFRGFLFEGLRQSRLGSAGTILLTSLVWACIHLQYEWFYVAQIFGVGLVLGAARASTGSLLTPIVAHAVVNATATLQAALLARPLSL